MTCSQTPSKNQLNAEKISVIIPTFNGAKWIGKLFESLKEQTVQPNEIIVIDSSSDDCTCEIAKRYNATVLVIEQADFDHGRTRSAAAKRANGSILVFFTQDAVLSGPLALQNLIDPLLKNKKNAASYGRQLPADDATPISQHLRFFNYPDTSQVRCWKDREKFGFKTVFISNSFAAYRRNALQEVNFFPDNIIFGEDTCTLAKLMQKGYCVHYVNNAMVVHSHNYTLVQDVRRYFDIGVLHKTEEKLFAPFGAVTGAGKKFVIAEIVFLWQEKKYGDILQSVARNISKFIAYKCGRHYTHLPHSIVRKMSMHRSWWK